MKFVFSSSVFLALFLLSNNCHALSLSMSTTTPSKTTTRSTGSYNKIVKNEKVPGLKNGMDYIKLGDSDLVVSKVCMGTMTIGGRQNTLFDGVDQFMRAREQYGVNFYDTAELYPVPPSADTQGRTDLAVAKFLKQVPRNEIVLASKVAGRNPDIRYMPRRKELSGQGTQLSREHILDSVDASLKRLETDYIDLLQLHWPDRYTGAKFGAPDFRVKNYENSPEPHSFEEQLSAVKELIDSGKVRYVGISNETPYGVCSFAQLAQSQPDLYPKIVSIQNSYSLVVRKDFEAGTSEACYHHNVGLLPYSPLAGGTLTGKYRNGPVKNARLSMFPGYMERYLGSQNEMAVAEYCKIAEKNNLTPTQLALSWCFHNPLVASTIIGATSLEQLDQNIKSYDVKLNKDILADIEKVYQKYTDPTKAMK